MKAEQQAQQTRQTVLAKQQQQEKSRMKDVGSFASKYQPPSFEGEDEKWEEWARVFRYWSEQFHSESTFYDEKVVIEKELTQMLKPEDPSDHLNWETPNANGYELRSEHKELEQSECENDAAEETMSVLVKLAKEPLEPDDIDQQKSERRMRRQPFFKHKYKKETEETIFHNQYNIQETHYYETSEANEYEFQWSDIIGNMNVSIISDFLNSMTLENMSVASLGLSGTDEHDLLGDLEEFEQTRHDVRSSVSENKKSNVNVELTLPSEHKKITSTFVIEGTQTVENEEYQETIKELSKNKKSHTMLVDDVSNLKNLENPLMNFAVNEQSEKFTPHGSETTLLSQLVETSMHFNVKEYNAMTTEINDKKFYNIIAQFKQ